MLEHINKLRSLHDQLKEMGVEIDDKELAMTLLASLPEDYKPLITALDAVGEGDLSYEKIKNMLLNEVDRSKYLKNSEDAFSMRRGKFNYKHMQKFKARKWKRKSKQGKSISRQMLQLSRKRAFCPRLPEAKYERRLQQFHI